MRAHHYRETFIETKHQSLLTDEQGRVLESDNHLLHLSPGTLLSEVHPLFEDFQLLFEDENHLHYPAVHFEGRDLQAQIDVQIHRVEEGFFIFFEDRSDWYQELRNIQQERNEKGLANTSLLRDNQLLQVERELLRLKNTELKRMQEFKAEFFSKVSHELRTPINGILGLSKLLGRGEGMDAEGKYLKSLQTSAQHLQSIVNDVLDMSKIESGKFELHATDVNLVELIDDIALSFYYQAEEKGLKLETDVDNTLPTWVKVDATRLKQILYNLLNNAMKFTEQGKVGMRVGFERSEREGKDYRILFDIYDTGIGIASDKLNSIFQEYTQAESETHSKYGGTGLGLSVVQQLVELHGGKISVSSTLGQGSTFSFDLYLEVGTNTQIPLQQSKPSIQRKNLSILVVDDDALNRMIIKKQLEGQEASLSLCSSVEEALVLLEKEEIDLVISDVNMTGQSGIDLAYALREKSPLVFLLTGDVLPPDHAVFQDEVVVRAFLKPIHPVELISAINHYF